MAIWSSLKTIGEIKTHHKPAFYLLIAIGIIIPIIVSALGNPLQSVFFLRLVLCLIIYWLFFIPSIIRIFTISGFLVRIVVVVGVLIPLILSMTVHELKILNKYYPKEKVLSSIETKKITWQELFNEEHTPSPKSDIYVSTAKQVDVFTFFSGLIWFSILILLWIYDGYLLSKEKKTISS